MKRIKQTIYLDEETSKKLRHYKVEHKMTLGRIVEWLVKKFLKK